MNHSWQPLGPIAPGGAIFDIACDRAGRFWLATSAGIFRPAGDSWSALRNGQPIAQINALAWAAGKLLAGGDQGQIVYSTDEGETWYLGRVSQTEAAITCLAVSPNFACNRVMLAGTGGDGVLRSNDGGRSWRLSNAGLQDFTVLALAAAPDWGRREVVFAGTGRGLYRSPNGGRAWKLIEGQLEEAVVLALAVSPDFARDGIILAGAENDGLFRSTDGGRTWQPANLGLGGDGGDLPAINALWLHPRFAAERIGLAGTADGRIFRSEDGGANWRCVFDGNNAVLCLDGSAATLLAGLNDAGLLASSDNGQTWMALEGLAARAITRLIPGRDGNLYAFGPTEGAWHSADGGKHWRRLADIGQSEDLLLAMSIAAGPILFCGSTAGLWRSEDGGQTWQQHLAGQQISALAVSPKFVEDKTIWAGTVAGALWQSKDGGACWTILDFPGGTAPVAALAAGIDQAEEVVLAAGAVDFARHRAFLWISNDGGQSWQPWLEAEADSPVLHLSLAGEHPLVGFGQACWCMLAGQWQRVLETEHPLVRLAPIPGGREIFVTAAHEVLYSTDGRQWHEIDCQSLKGRLMDLAVHAAPAGPSGALALTSGGMLWHLAIWQFGNCAVD